MKVYLLLLIVFASLQANAGAAFSLVEKGNSVCRVEINQPERCLPSAKSMKFVDTDTVEVIELLGLRKSIESHTGGQLTTSQKLNANTTKFLEASDVDYALANYSRISARNFAFSIDDVKIVGAKRYVPFFASVYFKGRMATQFTVHMEGYIEQGPVVAPDSQLSREAQIRSRIQQTLQIESLSDSQTELKMEFGRKLEWALRQIHFRVVGLQGRSVDQATVDEVTRIVAPVVYGQVLNTMMIRAAQQEPVLRMP